MFGEREREESHFLGGGKKGGKMDVAEVPLAEKNRFQARGTSEERISGCRLVSTSYIWVRTF